MLLGAADGVGGARDRSDDDGGRAAAASRALLSPADYGAVFQRGQRVTPRTLGAALATVLAPGA
jgi:hypothetical protein